MSLLEELRNKEESIRTVGVRIREDAKRRGAPFSYMDPERPGVLIVENADGSTVVKPLSQPVSERKILP